MSSYCSKAKVKTLSYYSLIFQEEEGVDEAPPLHKDF